jgi:hypothetical protein
MMAVQGTRAIAGVWAAQEPSRRCSSLQPPELLGPLLQTLVDMC